MGVEAIVEIVEIVEIAEAGVNAASAVEGEIAVDVEIAVNGPSEGHVKSARRLPRGQRQSPAGSLPKGV